MAQHDFKETAQASVLPPISGYDAFFFDLADGHPKYKNSLGTVYNFPGSLVYQGAYSGSTPYVPYDFVTYNNSSYMCILASTGHLPTDPVYWTPLALKGVDGTAFIWQGTYAGGTQYYVNDVVAYNNSSYICIVNSLGNLPTNPAFWALMAQAGLGDVVGPAVAVTNDIVSFNGTTGKLVKDSGFSTSQLSFNVMDYGALGNGVHDDTTNIQAAITAAQSAGGGEVYFPTGHYPITATLTVSASSIKLIGEAGGAWYNVAGGDYTTQNGSWIHWVGGTAGTMIQIEPVAGASNANLKDIHLLDLNIDGRHPNAIPNPGATFGTQAGIGVSIKSTTGFHFNCLYIQDCSTNALLMGVIAGALGEIKCCRNGNISRICINQQDGLAATTGVGILLDGAGTTNTNFNVFSNLLVLYSSATGIKFQNGSQYNQFIGCICERYSGTGIGVEFTGSNSAANLSSSSNQFFGGSAGQGGCTSRGTGLSFPAFDNFWYGYTIGGAVGIGEPQPTIEPGASFYYTVTGASPNGGNQAFNSGRVTQLIFQGSAVATSGTGETLLHKATIPANVVQAGQAFRIRLHGFSSSTGTLIFRIRIGAAGTVGGDTQSWISITSAAQVANQRAGFEGIVHLRTLAIARSEALGYAQAALLPTLVAAPADTAVVTTAIWYIDVTCTCSVGTYTSIMCTIEAI